MGDSQLHLQKSFLDIYPFAYLNYSKEVADKCAEYVVTKSGVPVCDMLKLLSVS